MHKPKGSQLKLHRLKTEKNQNYVLLLGFQSFVSF